MRANRSLGSRAAGDSILRSIGLSAFTKLLEKLLMDRPASSYLMWLALSGYLYLMQTGWNFLLFVFLRIVLLCERRSHVSANV